VTEFVIPISYGSTEVIETGKWGFQKPETAFMTAPCQEACPAGNPIPQFLYFAAEGRYDDALRALLRENPFPGVCGRVCFHPCETHCNRGEYDESVSISAMERYVFDATLKRSPDIPSKSNPHPKQIAIVGSGPAGPFVCLFSYTVRASGDHLGGSKRAWRCDALGNSGIPTP